MFPHKFLLPATIGAILLPILGGAGLAQAWTEPVRIDDVTGRPRAALDGRNIYVVEGWESHDFRFLRSTDNGRRWSEPIQPADTFYGSSASPDIEYTPNGLIHVAWVGEYPDIYVAEVFHQSSSDGGLHWSNRHQVFNNNGHLACYFPSLASKGDTLFVAFVKLEGIHFFRSFDSGFTWQDSTVVDSEYWGAPPVILYSQGRLHLIYELNLTIDGPKVYYRQSNDLGVAWSPRICLSEPFSYFSQNPAAYADNYGHLLTVWSDYFYGYTCGVDNRETLGRVSVDNAETWLPETRVTYTQTTQAPHGIVVNDTLHVAWTDAYTLGCDYNKITMSTSNDWGASWSAPEVITGSRETGEFVPFIFYTTDRGTNYLHCLFAAEETPGDYSVYYIRDKGFYNDRKPIPGPQPAILKVSAYPNVFNASTIITYQNWVEDHAEIEILDISGRKIWSRGVSGKEGSIIWDAVDNRGQRVCSGNYFVRVKTTGAEETIRLILLK
jgi:hypothetical protein